MRCDQCKFWNAESANQEWEAKKAGFGECEAVRPRWEIMDEVGGYRIHEWDEGHMTPAELMDAKVDQRIAALKVAHAYVQDGSEYRAQLFTASDFFCALFQQRAVDLPAADEVAT
jgi:hypothetical protein